MERTNLSAADRRVRDLHHQGFPPSRIARMTGRAERDVRAVVTGCWHDDKLAAKAAKRSRRS